MTENNEELTKQKKNQDLAEFENARESYLYERVPAELPKNLFQLLATAVLS